jgi:UDP-2,3-diacylglucosamine pyrophosphatase LpxH
MTTLVEGINTRGLSQQYPEAALDNRRTHTHRRLTEVLKAAQAIPLDDSSRIVFFSDCHRGDDSRADAFALNKELFLHALTFYYNEGFTYIEVGDGDELYKNRFKEVQRAHERAFDLLHRFDRQNRLHLIVGNHDIENEQDEKVEKDGIVAHEGLILRCSRTGQQIFVVHGHQADLMSDQFRVIGRLVVRHIWRPVQLAGFCQHRYWVNHTHALKTEQQIIKRIHQAQQNKIERRIVSWLKANRQIVICGHTHRPFIAEYGMPPYFNTGSCVYPGFITGLEIQNREIKQVKWSMQPYVRNGGAQHISRQLLAPPRELGLFS